MASPIWSSAQLSLDGYLAFEEAAPLRHEFVAGEVYAMAGASTRHHRILSNIHRRVANAAAGGPCAVYVEGVKLRVRNDFYYADMMVECSPSELNKLVVLDPCLLVEITSPSTARVDRTQKLDAYQAIPSLHAYLVVEQAWRRVVRHWRDATGAWQQEDHQSDGTIDLPCPELSLTVDQIYEGLAPLTVREMEALGYGVEYA
ncbi:MAG: Uma2 family endonuclease [Gemmatimonadota bacterium]